MKIVAVMSCRNEEAYLPTCLHHLVSQGIHFAVVDNGSTDASMDIIHSSEFRSHLVGLKRVPFTGDFELEPLLMAKMSLANETEADWAINICPDEILHPNREGRTLLQEIQLFDKRGFNAVNFDEFVFLPVDEEWEVGLRGWPRMVITIFPRRTVSGICGLGKRTLVFPWRPTAGTCSPDQLNYASPPSRWFCVITCSGVRNTLTKS